MDALERASWQLWWELVGLCHEDHRRPLRMLGATQADLSALALAASVGGRVGQPISGVVALARWLHSLDADRDGGMLDRADALLRWRLPPASNDPQRLARGVISHYSTVAKFNTQEFLANPGRNLRWELGSDYPPRVAEPLVKSGLLFPEFNAEAGRMYAILRAWPERLNAWPAPSALVGELAVSPGLVVESSGLVVQRATVVGECAGPWDRQSG